MDNTIIPLNELLEKYLTNKDTDDDENYYLKQKIRKLSTLHQHILLQYIETQSLRKTAKIFNCSSTSISNILKKIKETLK